MTGQVRELLDGFLKAHERHETAPRETCPDCQFEVERGTLVDHICQ